MGNDPNNNTDAPPDLLPVRIPGTNQMFWVPPSYIDQAEAAVKQMRPQGSGGGAGAVGTFADIAEGVADFFAQDQIQRQINQAKKGRADLKVARDKYYKTLSSGAQQQAFIEMANAQDTVDFYQSRAIESSVTMLRVSALAAAGRGLGRIFNNQQGGMSIYGQMGGSQSPWGPALITGVAAFGLAEIFIKNSSDPDPEDQVGNYTPPA